MEFPGSYPLPGWKYSYSSYFASTYCRRTDLAPVLILLIPPTGLSLYATATQYPSPDGLPKPIQPHSFSSIVRSVQFIPSSGMYT